MIIAVDFDGAIVERKYPGIGKEIPFATLTLKMLQNQGHRLILWTKRSGKELDDAVAYCRSKGIEFYAVNKNYPEEIFEDNISREIKADMFINDRNYGGFPDWGVIFRKICKRERKLNKVKKGVLSRIFK